MSKNELNNKLVEAVKEAVVKDVAKLLKQGADANTEVDKKGNAVLMQAAENGNLEIVRLLVEYGADIDHRNKKEEQTAFFFACWEGHEEVAGYLIDKGTDVLTPKRGGRTTLMYACHSNSASLVGILLDKGVDINAANDVGLTALMYTDEDDKKLDAMRVLLERGASIDQTNSIGKTSVMRAVNLGSLKAAEILLEHGANTKLVCDNGWGLLAMAESAEKHDREMVALLKRYGVAGDMRYYSFKIKMDCPECGQPIVLNGPVEKIKCSSCQSIVKLDMDMWESVVDSAEGLGGDTSILTHSGFGFTYRNARPACTECKDELDVDKIATGTETTLVCGKCGKSNSSFPCPDWLRNFKHDNLRPVQLFCADREGETGHDESAKMKPIAVKCISCGAVLHIDTKTPRNATCRHCSTLQYLPDGLWLALHPVKKAVTWYMRYELC